ncbi:unnamed protein product [Ambrosiozyma monospora]|uniref:Unnamed protein product n=1 Tax=Ambrosiozyma monospora TaxID=43982 RepID=A0A9W7DFY5_AMBMO|nr:unnamed protein product [Ambrosiozyma monospora]
MTFGTFAGNTVIGDANQFDPEDDDAFLEEFDSVMAGRKLEPWFKQNEDEIGLGFGLVNSEEFIEADTIIRSQNESITNALDDVILDEDATVDADTDADELSCLGPLKHLVVLLECSEVLKT